MLLRELEVGKRFKFQEQTYRRVTLMQSEFILDSAQAKKFCIALKMESPICVNLLEETTEVEEFVSPIKLNRLPYGVRFRGPRGKIFWKVEVVKPCTDSYCYVQEEKDGVLLPFVNLMLHTLDVDIERVVL